MEMDKVWKDAVSIRVVGIGGGGGNAVNHMYNSGMRSAEFISIDREMSPLRCSAQGVTDADISPLSVSKAPYELNIGQLMGMSTESSPEIGQKAAEESREEIAAALKGAQMVIIVAGMGGGTGTGAAPVVAEIARNMGILTLGAVTLPFKFEGDIRIRQAQEGVAWLKDKVDALLVIPSEQRKHITKLTLQTAFSAADEVLCRAVRGIADLLNFPDDPNVDLADVTSTVEGFAYVGFGWARGAGCAERAAKEAIASLLLEASIHDAREIIIHLRMSPGYDYDDIDVATTVIHDAASEKATIVWGYTTDENMEDETQVTLIASDFETAAGPIAAGTAWASPADGAAALKEAPDDDTPDIGDIIRMPENR